MSAVNYLPVAAELMQLISPEQAWHYRIVPKRQAGNRLEFFAENDTDQHSLTEELEIILGREVALSAVSPNLIEASLSKYFVRREDSVRTGTADKQAQVLSDDFLLNLIAEAKQFGSSDIHIETYDEKARVRIRIDGQLVERYLLKKEDYPALINKIKIKANLDIAEKRLPQDGRIFFARDRAKFDIRVSIVPTLFGEKVVMRLLSNDATEIDLYKLGFDAFDLNNYLEGVRRPTGMLLISGPTGSGKTTTLYATLKLLNQESRNILTIEDPIEYTLGGINQVQLKENIGLDFASALRTFLRQDPDIIMVGEIRDPETANMAIRAALTGHLVLSTIHTNSAWGTVSRLIDMGIPPFLVADTLNTTVAQRLLRLLCPHCKTEQPFDERKYPKQFRPFSKVTRHFLPKGCSNCFFTGFRGRKAVYEVIPIDLALAEELKKGQTNVTGLLQERGIKTLAENAFRLFEDGTTTIDEIYPLLYNY